MHYSKKILAALLFATAILPLAAEGAYLDFFDGDVTIRRGNTVLTADFGMELEEGDAVVTGAASVAIIALADRGQIKLQPWTTLNMNSLGRNVEVGLDLGAVFSRLDRLNGGSYRLRAGNALAGVRGTEFFTAYGKLVEDGVPDIWLCVNEGLVDVSLDNGRAVEVAEGQGINIVAGNDITPPQFFAWTTDLNWNMDPTQGEILDRTDLSGLYDEDTDPAGK